MQCSRCDADAVTRTRGENFCENCYHEFLVKKVRSTMGPFRVVGSSHPEPSKLIVFLSFGASSIALVDLLMDMLNVQKKKYGGMVGFEFECVHFGPDIVDTSKWPWPEVSLKTLPEPSLLTAESEKQLSRSSKQDVQNVLLRRAALELATRNNATAVFGYSMTKLSELTLAETVKGRGANIPSIVSPDLEEDHAVYPLREITLPEVEQYCKNRGLDGLIRPGPSVPGITKMQSIDEIVRQYFADVRKGFPSVVSTVSKVATRLSQEPDACALCQPSESASTSTQLCYACRSALGEERLSSPLSIVQQYEI